MKKAVVAGHLCLDIIPAIDHHFDLIPGHLFEVGAPLMATGGAVSNTGMTMHILGTPTKLMGKVGDDDFGKTILNIVKARDASLAEGMTISKGSATSYTMVINIPGTDRIFLHCPGANATYCTDDLNMAELKDVQLFHFGYPCFMAKTYENEGAELIRMYKTVHDMGITTSMDPGMPDPHGPAGKVDWKTLLSKVLPYTDVFMPSADELLYMMMPERFGDGDNIGVKELEKLGDELIGFGAAVVAIKLGQRGMYIQTASAERFARMGAGAPECVADWASRRMLFPTFNPDKFMGATGAGDSSIGGFLCAMLRNCKLEEAGLFAAAVGACNVEAPDSLSGVRSWDATMARINSGWSNKATQVSEPGWSLNSKNIWSKA
ncbi:MAG: carbohydrate kinase family protein [Victivallales bacterium]|nr:carbohydrate kinase family protein [Victivallales bacterium]